MVRDASNLGMNDIERVFRGRQPALPEPDAVARAASVYVLFSQANGDIELILIKRSESVGQHKGEYAFPGGGVEPFDSSYHDAALREVREELGVPSSAIIPWGGLEPQRTVTSGFIVVPFTGCLTGREFQPAPDEVSEVVPIPLGVLLDPANRRTISRLIPSPGGTGETHELKVYPAYAHSGRVIWGATARILDQVVSLLLAA